MMLIKFGVFHCDNGVDKVPGQLIVRYCLPVFDVDLAEDFSVAIENHTR